MRETVAAVRALAIALIASSCAFHEGVAAQTGPGDGADSADLSIDVTASPEPVANGAALTYAIAVANLGPDAAASLTVTNTLPAGATYVSATGAGWTCASSGQNVTCTNAALAVGAAPGITIMAISPATGGSIVDTASVTAATADPSAANNSASVTTTVVVTPSADLSIAVTDAPDPVTAGSTLTYSVDVSNAGATDAASLTVTDTLPAGTTFTSATGTGWTCGVSGQVVTCTRATLAVGAAPTITIAVTAPTQGGSIDDTAAVMATTGDPNTANNTATATTAVTASSDLSITVTDSPDPVNTGRDLTYTVNVSNAGPSDAANVTVTDLLPLGTTYTSATGTGWACSALGQSVTCTRATLAVGAAPAITIMVKAPSTAGMITDNVSVTATTMDPAAGNNFASTTTTVTVPTATFDAAASASGSGTTLTWTHTASGTNRLVVVGVSWRNTATISSVTYGGVAMTQILTSAKSPESLAIYRLVNPPTGASTVTVTFNTSINAIAGSTSFTNVDQASPIRGSASSTGTNSTASVTVSSATTDVVLDTLAYDNNASTISAAAGQTERWNKVLGGNGAGGGSTKPGAASVQMSWTASSADNWALAAISIAGG